MKSLVLLVALLLWPSSVPAFPSITVTSDEERNLNHYVQDLQNLLLSVPTKGETGHEAQTKATSSVAPTGTRAIQYEEISTDKDVVLSPLREVTTPVPHRAITVEDERRKRTKRTAFWSIKPNNISVVLRTKEPYIEREEEPEAIVRPTGRTTPLSPVSDVAKGLQVTSRTSLTPTSLTPTTREGSDLRDSTELEDVPQLSGEENLEGITFGKHAQTLNNDDILKKISDIRFQVQQAPRGDSLNEESREDIRASKDDLRRSIALAAAAEQKLTKMSESQILPLGQTGNEVDNIEAVINVLYNSRDKIPEYFDIKYVPPEMREKTSTVFNALKKILCVGGGEAQSLIRRLIKISMRLLRLLNTS
ncbi:sperm equatorial segment protein 1 [Echinops telfairi]|uniref:Sperm equatorial segment protein 1 n=1 Tax=Echinops telfairi TaxID=9371 RepID=A0AC55CRN2_ECHTE|nr:sperm equatorial segment protein 1 [Echinops telfairi]